MNRAIANSLRALIAPPQSTVGTNTKQRIGTQSAEKSGARSAETSADSNSGPSPAVLGAPSVTSFVPNLAANSIPKPDARVIASQKIALRVLLSAMIANAAAHSAALAIIAALPPANGLAAQSPHGPTSPNGDHGRPGSNANRDKVVDISVPIVAHQIALWVGKLQTRVARSVLAENAPTRPIAFPPKSASRFAPRRRTSIVSHPAQLNVRTNVPFSPAQDHVPSVLSNKTAHGARDLMLHALIDQTMKALRAEHLKTVHLSEIVKTGPALIAHEGNRATANALSAPNAVLSSAPPILAPQVISSPASAELPVGSRAVLVQATVAVPAAIVPESAAHEHNPASRHPCTSAKHRPGLLVPRIMQPPSCLTRHPRLS